MGDSTTKVAGESDQQADQQGDLVKLGLRGNP